MSDSVLPLPSNNARETRPHPPTAPGANPALQIQPGAAGRRRRYGLLITLVWLLSFGVSGLIITLLWLQHEVERHRVIAEAERSRADALVYFLLSDLHADLAPLGRLDLLEKPARKALAYFESLPEWPASPAMLHGRNVALNNIGDVLTRQGDLPRALDVYREALALAERLAQHDPMDKGRQRDLAVSYAKLGDASEARGDLSGAREAYGKALNILDGLSDAESEAAQYQYDLALIHERLGNVLHAEANFPGALEQYQARQIIMLQLTTQVPDNLVWQRDLGHSYGALGDLFMTQGDRPAAKAAYQRYAEIASQLSTQDPNSMEWQRDLAVSYEKTGDLRAVQGDVTGAKLAYQKFAEIAARLVSQDVRNVQWQRDLAASDERVAALLMVQGSPAEAIVKQRRAADLLAAVASRVGSGQSRAEAASAFGRLSRYYLLQSQPNDAVDAAQRGLTLDASQARIKLNLAHGLLYSGRLAEAERVYRQNRSATLNNEKRFDEEALAELREFIARGIVPPEMAKVEDWLRPRG